MILKPQIKKCHDILCNKYGNKIKTEYIVVLNVN